MVPHFSFRYKTHSRERERLSGTFHLLSQSMCSINFHWNSKKLKPVELVFDASYFIPFVDCFQV